MFVAPAASAVCNPSLKHPASKQFIKTVSPSTGRSNHHLENHAMIVWLAAIACARSMAVYLDGIKDPLEGGVTGGPNAG